MRYISDDNKVFNTEQECFEHEKLLKEDKIKRDKLLADKNKRKDEVVAAYRAFMELSNRYANDYCESIMVKRHSDNVYLFNKLYPRSIWCKQ